MTRTEELMKLCEVDPLHPSIPSTIKQLVELVRLLVPLVEECCDSHLEYDNTKHKEALAAFNKFEGGE